MMSSLLLAQAATPYPMGRVVGGWEYVYASYALAIGGLLLYAASLWLRRRATKEGP